MEVTTPQYNNRTSSTIAETQVSKDTPEIQQVNKDTPEIQNTKETEQVQDIQETQQVGKDSPEIQNTQQVSKGIPEIVETRNKR